MKNILLLVCVLCFFSQPVTAVEINAGGAMATALMDIRLRSFNNTGGGEVYAGVASVGSGANRTEINHTWVEDNWLEINYDHVSDLLRVTLFDGMGMPINSLDYPNWEANMQAIIGPQFSTRDLNALNVIIYNREGNGELSFEAVELNGNPLGGDFDLPPGQQIPSVDNWLLTGECFASFNLYGNLVRSGTFSNSQELGKVEFQVGIDGTVGAADAIFSNGFDYCY